MIGRLTIPLSLANDHDIYLQYQAICRTLTDLTKQTDPILREIAGLKLASIVDQLSPLADGTALFAGTEGWRTVYEKLLESPDLKEYRSVAWVRNKDYWQDAPGRQSMEANFAAIQRRVLIERIFILRDDLWPKDELLRVGEIRSWIENQHNHGVWVLLARESELASEPGLIFDMGIYGTRAVGTQELDERCRTLRFSLTFDPQTVRLARDRWDRLYLFSTSFQSLLDRAPTDAWDLIARNRWRSWKSFFTSTLPESDGSRREPKSPSSTTWRWLAKKVDRVTSNDSCDTAWPIVRPG